MKKVAIGVVVLILGGAGYYFVGSASLPAEKLYVASEADGKVTVIDPATRKVIREFNLGVEHDGGVLQYNPHNIQVAPDNKSVWITANVGVHHASASLISSASAHGGGGPLDTPDEVIVINPLKDRIIKRIPIATGIHLAHVVLTPDSKTAYVTAQQEGVIYKINTETYEVLSVASLPALSEPHGMRISPDGKTAYIAFMGSKKLGVLDLATEKVTEVDLGASPVQTAITPDGKTAAASLYDTRAVALYDVTSKKLEKVALPADAEGPIQLYPTPDSKFMYVADQGYYFAKPKGTMLYKLNISEKKVVMSLPLDSAPHGIVISEDGKFAYVTNLLGNNVSIVDLATDTEIGRIPVGREPNGVSLWYNREAK